MRFKEFLALVKARHATHPFRLVHEDTCNLIRDDLNRCPIDAVANASAECGSSGKTFDRGTDELGLSKRRVAAIMDAADNSLTDDLRKKYRRALLRVVRGVP